MSLYLNPDAPTSSPRDTAAGFTGSRVYGSPRDDSDLDLCLLVTDAEYAMLAATADREKDQKTFLAGSPAGGGRYGTKTRSFRFGRLNVLATTDGILFDAWRKATVDLKTANGIIGPVSRDQAIQVFKKHEGKVK